mgnify:CR=1 FL=1
MASKNYIRTNTHHCDNCDFHTHDKQKFKIHLGRKRHLENEKNSTKECRLCEEKFTEEGYAKHLETNKNLINLWHNRNHHTGVGYNEDSWKIGFKEFGGHLGELLPKCGINRAWNRKFNNFDETLAFILREFKKMYNGNNRPMRGKLLDPFYYITHDMMAPYEELTEEEELIYQENDKQFQVKVDKKKEVKTIESLEKMLNFKFTDIHLEHGYYVDLNRNVDFKFNHQTYKFAEFIGLYQPNHYLKELASLSKDYNSEIIFLPDEDNRRYGYFLLENPDDGSCDQIAAWKEGKDNEDREFIWMLDEGTESD